MKLALHLPINSVSFGQVSTLLLRTIYEQEKAGVSNLDVYLFPVGGIDLSSQDKLPQDFQQWIQNKIVRSLENYHRDLPIFKLWHLNGSLESFSKQQSLLTFYELDRPTRVELNIARNNKTLFTSKYSCEVFSAFGVKTDYLPLGFDSFNFSVLDRKFHTDGRIVFNLCGKFENRKRHAQVIKAWISKYGNNRKYALQCAIYNPFLVQQMPNGQVVDHNNRMIGGCLEGKPKPFNVEFLPNFKENGMYNNFLNSGNIIIGMSGGEGWGLPEFQSVALGKHAVILNAHGYKSWANESNSTLVSPSDKVSSVDGMFFREGDIFNQGNIFNWNVDEFIAGCEAAIKKVETNPINTDGFKLQEEFSKEKFLSNVLSKVEK